MHYFESGFAVRKPSWHGLETVIDDFPVDWDDARAKAGLLWEPAIRPLYQVNVQSAVCEVCGHRLNDLHAPDCPHGQDDATLRVGPAHISADALKASIYAVDDKRLVVRDDTEASLGVVSDQYSLVYHSQMGEILEAILKQPNVKFETAGSVKGGALVWALAYLDEPYTVAGDDTETYPFVALLNSHDGSGACKVTRTQVRVVCYNTIQAASLQGDRTGLQFVFRHVGDVQSRIAEAIEALDGARSEAHEWDELATELFGMKADEVVFNHYLADFIPEPPAEIVSDRVRENVDRARKIFKSIYLDSVTTEAHRGTALGLVDASVEYLDHVRGHRNRDTLLGRTLLRAEPMKAKAVALAREHCR